MSSESLAAAALVAAAIAHEAAAQQPGARVRVSLSGARALLGALVGHAIETECWAPIALDTLPALPPSLAETRTAPCPGAAPPAPLHFTVRF